MQIKFDTYGRFRPTTELNDLKMRLLGLMERDENRMPIRAVFNDSYLFHDKQFDVQAQDLHAFATALEDSEYLATLREFYVKCSGVHRSTFGIGALILALDFNAYKQLKYNYAFHSNRALELHPTFVQNAIDNMLLPYRGNTCQVPSFSDLLRIARMNILNYVDQVSPYPSVEEIHCPGYTVHSYETGYEYATDFVDLIEAKHCITVGNVGKVNHTFVVKEGDRKVLLVGTDVFARIQNFYSVDPVSGHFAHISFTSAMRKLAAQLEALKDFAELQEA